MHITLTGNLGSGKSTISKIFSEQGYEIYSTGKIQRTLAAERGLTVLEMNKLMETDHSFDNIIDETTTRLSKEHTEDLFFDSRLAWHFAVNSFKIFLSVDIDEAARRVYNDDKRGDVEKYKSVDEAKANLIARAEAEDSRYKELYDINYFDMNNYNLVLDSTYASPEVLAGIIAKEKASYEKKVAGGADPASIPSRILISPARLLGSDHGSVRRDDDDIFDTDDVIIKREGSSLTLVKGSDTVWKAMNSGYEFITVKEA